MLNKEDKMGQGKREDQIQFSMMVFMIGLIGTIVVLSGCLVAVVIGGVWG